MDAAHLVIVYLDLTFTAYYKLYSQLSKIPPGPRWNRHCPDRIGLAETGFVRTGSIRTGPARRRAQTSATDHTS